MAASMTLSQQIKAKGLELGFSHVGIIPCHDFEDYAAEVAARPGYQRFIDNPRSFYAGCFLSKYFPQGKSIICATYGFGGIDCPEKLLAHIGRIYLARCYVPTPENIAGRRITAMTEYLSGLGMEVYDNEIELPARPAAVEAGIVQYGNNNFVYTEEDGSFVVVYAWLVDAELDYDFAVPSQSCPRDCNLCIKACPTGAIVTPRTLLPPRCVLLNDLVHPITPELMNLVGERIHGCDVCQTVCPRNHQVLQGPKRTDPFLELVSEEFDLRKVLLLESFDDEYYRVILQPIMYNYIRDVDVFRYNAAVAMGNSGDTSYLPALHEAAEKFAGQQSADAIAWAIEMLEG